MNTAIYSPSGANSGVGFAIPVDALRRSVEQIIQFGKVVRPILGISFAPDQSVEQVITTPYSLRLDSHTLKLSSEQVKNWLKGES